MSDTKDMCRMLGIELTCWQLWACEFLEARGLRFCVDFGYENAEAKADELVGNWLVQ